MIDATSDDDVFRSSHTNRIIGSVPQKKVKSAKVKPTNPLLANLKRNISKVFLPYTTSNLIKAYSVISKNSTNIGYAANAEMILSCIGVTNKSMFKMFSKKYNWNLEKIIDATVKDGTSADNEINTIHAFGRYSDETQIFL